VSDRAIIPSQALPPAIVQAVSLWADASTDASTQRRHDLIRDKTAALVGNGDRSAARGFYHYTGKAIQDVTALDVSDWRAHLESAGLSPASIYARVSRLSSFYAWLKSEPQFAEYVHTNPVNLSRPKAPKPYQSDKTQALDDTDAAALLRLVREDAKGGDLAAKRDYAMLRFYFATGKRRAEIAGLRWGDVKASAGKIVLNTREKGGLYRTTEITDPGVSAALFDYLRASGRAPDTLADDAPLWLRHDRAATGQQAVTSHGFVKALKVYAQRAGIGDMHLHQTRHTVARMVGEESGNMSDVQAILGHENQATTKVYLQRVSVKRDKYSQAIADRLGLDED
jgi:integrase/recombinase XerD